VGSSRTREGSVSYLRNADYSDSVIAPPNETFIRESTASSISVAFRDRRSGSRIYEWCARPHDATVWYTHARARRRCTRRQGELVPRDFPRRKLGARSGTTAIYQVATRRKPPMRRARTNFVYSPDAIKDEFPAAGREASRVLGSNLARELVRPS